MNKSLAQNNKRPLPKAMLAGRVLMAATDKSLAQMNKSSEGHKATKRRTSPMNRYRQGVDALLSRLNPSRTLS